MELFKKILKFTVLAIFTFVAIFVNANLFGKGGFVGAMSFINFIMELVFILIFGAGLFYDEVMPKIKELEEKLNKLIEKKSTKEN